MKKKRLADILEIIRDHSVSTQEELLALLRQRGYDVTQATISRDIKELRLIKMPDHFGIPHYAAPVREARVDRLEKFRTIFQESAVSVAAAQNLVIIKCYTGMANAACATLDSITFENIVGTIAGDDTIFVAVSSPEAALNLSQELSKML
jgi:transcriptional regulator of arginine metabolism